MDQRVLIFESDISGHRGYYVQVLANELLRLGANVCMAIPENASETSEGKLFLSELTSHVDVLGLPNTSTNLGIRGHSQARLSKLVSSVEKCQPNHVYVPYADGISQAWGLKPRPNSLFRKDLIIEGLMMRGSFAYKPANLRQRTSREITYQLLMRSRWSRIHQLDPLAFADICRRSPLFAKRNRLIPEAITGLKITDRFEACELLGLDPANKFVCCPGLVTSRKGIDLLLAAFQETRADNLQLILIGKQTPEIQELLATRFLKLIREKRVIASNRFATDLEFDALFAVADLICVPYPRHIGSASILIRAAKADKRIVSSNYGWVGWATSRFNLGAVCDVENATDFSEAIRMSLNEPRDENPKETARQAFLDFHSEENYATCFTQMLAERNGLFTTDKFESLEVFNIDHSNKYGYLGSHD